MRPRLLQFIGAVALLSTMACDQVVQRPPLEELLVSYYNSGPPGLASMAPVRYPDGAREANAWSSLAFAAGDDHALVFTVSDRGVSVQEADNAAAVFDMLTNGIGATVGAAPEAVVRRAPPDTLEAVTRELEQRTGQDLRLATQDVTWVEIPADGQSIKLGATVSVTDAELAPVACELAVMAEAVKQAREETPNGQSKVPDDRLWATLARRRSEVAVYRALVRAAWGKLDHGLRLEQALRSAIGGNLGPSPAGRGLVRVVNAFVAGAQSEDDVVQALQSAAADYLGRRRRTDAQSVADPEMIVQRLEHALPELRTSRDELNRYGGNGAAGTVQSLDELADRVWCTDRQAYKRAAETILAGRIASWDDDRWPVSGRLDDGREFWIEDVVQAQLDLDSQLESLVVFGTLDVNGSMAARLQCGWRVLDDDGTPGSWVTWYAREGGTDHVWAVDLDGDRRDEVVVTYSILMRGTGYSQLSVYKRYGAGRWSRLGEDEGQIGHDERATREPASVYDPAVLIRSGPPPCIVVSGVEETWSGGRRLSSKPESTVLTLVEGGLTATTSK